MHTLYRSWLLASLVAAVLLWPARLDARTASPAAAFTSVKSGAWSDPATWGGTSIPGVEDAVTIAAGHTVDITQGAKAGALTIAAGATIRRVSGADGVYVLEVEGAVVNRGTILWCHPVDFGYDRLALRVAGDVTNEGVWDADYTALDGTSTQRIVQAGAGLTNGLSRFWYDETPTSGLTAGSDLRFTGRLELRGATLDAGANQLILTGSEALDGGRTNGTGGVVRFAGGTLRSGPNFVLSNLRFEGPTTFAGSVQVGPNVSVVGALTVADSLRRMSGSDGVYVLEVEGSVTNQGTIFWCHPVDFGYDRLALRITGDVRNEGVWDADYTALNGSTAQRITLAGTGLTSGLGRLWYDEMPASGLTAGSDLRFTGRLELRGATLDAGANRLVVYQNLDVGLTGNAPGLPNGTVRFSTGGTVQAIPNSSADVNMVFANVTFEGPTTFTGHFNVGQNVVVRGPLAIAPGTILQRAGGSDGDWPLVVEGNVVNDGTIRWCNPRDFGYDKLVMRVSGSITNRGRWEAHQTYLTGTAAHTVRSDSVLHRTWYVADPGSEVVAGGPLYFSGPLRLGKGTLRMGAHTLTLDYGNDTSVDGGRIIFDGGTLRIVGNGGPLALANVRIDGGVTLVGKYDVGTNVTFGGNVTIPSGTVLQRASGGDGIWPMAVEGSLTNHGEVRPYNMDRDVGYDKLAIHLGGTLTNHGSYAPSYTRLVGARGHDVIAHRPIQNELSLERPATLVGRVVLRQALGSGVQTRDYLVARLTSSGSGLDSLVLDAYGNQPPANFGNAVRRTWTLRPVPALARVSLASLTLLYNDDVLGSAREDSLQVYHSADNGQTWTRVSTSANLTRDLNGNAVTLTSAPAFGTYVLSSRADAIPAGPNVVVSVTGPERIRVGPPNRYQLTYANVGSAPVEDFLLSVRTTDGIYIDHVLGSPGPDGQARRINPVDFSRAGDNTYATFWVRGLNPGEERVMTAVLKTTADIQGRASDGTWEPVNATMKPVPAVAVGVALALGGALTTDLATGILAGQLANVPQTPAEANQVVIDAVKKVGEDWLGSPEKGMSMASDELMGKLGAKVGNPIARAADLANAAGDIADGVRSGQERMGRYNALPPANLPRGRQPLAFPDPAPVTPSPVRSWDPNEKNGPVGVGTEGFVTSLGRVAYQIKFENKKEATAAAYEIVIVDTLASVFDPESVVFGETSWPGFTMERTGNVLRWRAEGIELPPNVNPPEGEGFVNFTVNVRDGLPSGTRVANRATIVFDINPPIVTNTHVNTLDLTPPTTVMRAMAAETFGNQTVVRWTAADRAGASAGAGVHSVTVFASRNGGAFLPVGTSRADSLVFSGEIGSTYQFYAMATDAVGNAEEVRPGAVATTLRQPTASEGDLMAGMFELGRTYPNPVRGQATVRFSVASGERVRLEVFDLLGKRVAVLLDGERTAGVHEVAWDAGTLASGVYLLRLQQGRNTQVQQAVVVR